MLLITSSDNIHPSMMKSVITTWTPLCTFVPIKGLIPTSINVRAVMTLIALYYIEEALTFIDPFWGILKTALLLLFTAMLFFSCLHARDTIANPRGKLWGKLPLNWPRPSFHNSITSTMLRACTQKHTQVSVTIRVPITYIEMWLWSSQP